MKFSISFILIIFVYSTSKVFGAFDLRKCIADCQAIKSKAEKDVCFKKCGDEYAKPQGTSFGLNECLNMCNLFPSEYQKDCKYNCNYKYWDGKMDSNKLGSGSVAAG